ncbi:MAG: hypothetical protein L0Y43_06920, partial [Methylococcaceae bacterium]|nr:hypothetical protein [Methylococcaceae bacterium]
MTGRNILLLCILAVITAGGAVYWLLPEPQQPGPFGPDPESAAQSLDQGEPPCPDARPEWRAKQVIEGVTLE